MSKFKVMLAAAGVMAALAAPALAAEKAADKAPPGDVAAGMTLFNQRCGICHITQDDGKQHPAPNLRGVIGRKAGSYPGFSYSPAIKAANITWTSAKIYQFLTGPQNLIPGTFMVVTVPKDDERANVVAYLGSLKK